MTRASQAPGKCITSLWLRAWQDTLVVTLWVLWWRAYPQYAAEVTHWVGAVRTDTLFRVSCVNCAHHREGFMRGFDSGQQACLHVRGLDDAQLGLSLLAAENCFFTPGFKFVAGVRHGSCDCVIAVLLCEQRLARVREPNGLILFGHGWCYVFQGESYVGLVGVVTVLGVNGWMFGHLRRLPAVS